MTTSVQNLESSRGNKVPNQFEISTPEGTFFQSYQTVIAHKTFTGITYLDPKHNHSKTTSKYRNIFLNMTSKEVEQNIKNGTIIIKSLN